MKNHNPHINGKGAIACHQTSISNSGKLESQTASRVHSRACPCAISTYFLQMARRKSDEGADPAHKFSGKNLLGSEFIPHKNVEIHLPSAA